MMTLAWIGGYELLVIGVIAVLIFGRRLNRYLMPSPSWENKSTNWIPRSSGCAGKNILRLPACSKCPALVL